MSVSGISGFMSLIYARDRVSATTASHPGMYFSSKSYGCMASMNLFILGGDLISGFENICFSGLWSFSIIK